jgi:DNA topoisomerase IA
MVNVLMVAEKPILAESIAKILSDGNCRTTKGKAFGFGVWVFVKPF